MKKYQFKRGLIVLLSVAAVSTGAVLLSSPGSTWAFPPAFSNQMRTDEMKTVTGKVVSTTQAPRREVDGVILEDGTWVHWPPHLENEYAPIAKPGATIQAKGRSEVNREGERWVETFELTNLNTKESYARDDVGPPPPPHRRPGPAERGPAARGNSETVSGVVQQLTTAPKGEVDGAVLNDGTLIHWPPHLEQEFAVLAKVGESVKVTGLREEAPRGELRFEVSSLTNTKSGKTAVNDGPPRRTEADRPGPHDPGSRLERLERRLERIEQQLSELLSR